MYKKKKLAKKKHRKNQQRLKALKVASLSKARPKKKIVSAPVEIGKEVVVIKPIAKEVVGKKASAKKATSKKAAASKTDASADTSLALRWKHRALKAQFRTRNAPPTTG